MCDIFMLFFFLWAMRKCTFKSLRSLKSQIFISLLEGTVGNCIFEDAAITSANVLFDRLSRKRSPLLSLKLFLVILVYYVFDCSLFVHVVEQERN